MMINCPKCRYILVLLEKRRRYKCAKCGSLYLQKLVDNKEFGRWNKWQREADKEALKPKKEVKQKNEGKAMKAFRLLFKENISKLTLEERKNRKRACDRKYYYENREKKILKRRELFINNKEYFLNYKKQRRQKRINDARLEDRIFYCRRRQRDLALRMIENEQPKVYEFEI